PEIPYTVEAICKVVQKRYYTGRRFSIVVVAEGAHERDGQVVTSKSTSHAHPERLGGIGPRLAAQIEEGTTIESRATVLGHLQRGGTPTYADRLLATMFGHHAAQLAAAGQWGKVVAWKGNAVCE